MKHYRIINAIISLTLTLYMLLPLFACAQSNENPDAATQADDSSAADVSEVETQIDDGLDGLDFKGQDVVIISRYLENWTDDEMHVEAANSEIVNDAVYNRELNVNDRLNVTIKNELLHTADMSLVLTNVERVNKSGQKEYDICAACCYTTLTSSLKGTFRNLRESEYIGFERDWWSQGYNEVTSYHDSQYSVMGDIVLSQYRFAFVTAFNKNIFDKKSTEYPYELVRNYEWTLDKQNAMIRDLASVSDTDPNADSNIYGLITNPYISVDPYWSSCKIDIISKNSDGDYEMVFDSGKLSDVCEKLIDMFYNGNQTKAIPHYGNDAEQEDIRKEFANGKGAMATLRLLELETGEVRGMTDSYGVLPMPTFDENQKEYRTLLHDQFTVISVPSVLTDDQLNVASAVIEAMAVDSYKNLTPAYYEVALKCKYMSDSDSWDMLDIIADNIYIDAGIIYTASLNSFHSHFRDIMTAKSNTVASKYKSVTNSTVKALNKLQQKLDRIAG